MIPTELVLATTCAGLVGVEHDCWWTLVVELGALSSDEIAARTCRPSPTIRRAVIQLLRRGMVRRIRHRRRPYVLWAAVRTWRRWVFSDPVMRTAVEVRVQRLETPTRDGWTADAEESARILWSLSGVTLCRDVHAPGWRLWCRTMEDLLEQGLHPVTLRELVTWCSEDPLWIERLTTPDPLATFLDRLPEIRLDWRDAYRARRRTFL